MRLLLLSMSCIFLCTCRENNASTSTMDAEQKMQQIERYSYLNAVEEGYILRPFTIKIDLDSASDLRIRNENKTMVIMAFATGIPDDERNVELEEDGSYFLSRQDVEIKAGEIAVFDQLKIPLKKFQHLSDKKFDVTVTVFTKRIQPDDLNILDVEPLSAPASEISGQNLTLKAKLIYD